MSAVLFLMGWLLLPSVVVLLWLLRPSARNAQEDAHRTARMTLIGLIVVVSTASLAFRLMVGHNLQQSAALFIGVPALLAMAAVFIPTQSAVGVACKSVTIGLLISMVFLGEGMLCVAMSAPLFYLVAMAIGMALDSSRRGSQNNRILSMLTLLSMVPMSMEGVTPFTTIDRETVVVATRTVHAPAHAVAAAVLAPPRFERELPRLLTWGFPTPLSTSSDGATISIQMRGGEMRLNGMEPRVGTLVLARDAAAPGVVSWRAVSDDSHMRHFLTWQSSRVEWEAIDAATTRVTWTIRYHRDLDPAWYFGPMERFVVRRAAEYLIEAVATP